MAVRPLDDAHGLMGHNLIMATTDKSHIDRIREQYDTKNLGAIMGRYRQAVSFDRQ